MKKYVKSSVNYDAVISLKYGAEYKTTRYLANMFLVDYDICNYTCTLVNDILRFYIADHIKSVPHKYLPPK